MFYEAFYVSYAPMWFNKSHFVIPPKIRIFQQKSAICKSVSAPAILHLHFGRQEVARNLQNSNYKTEITPIISSGDKNLDQPLYAMGITGVFTKDLDIALLNKEVDIAVHSLKDIPTQLPENLEIIAYLKRDFPQDVLVRNSKSKDKPLNELKIATSSLRRRAFWLKEFPNAEFVDIRGNVQTRLQKLEDGLADATMFSLAGPQRLGLQLEYEELPFMLSAPSQGVVAVVGHKDNAEINSILKRIKRGRNTKMC